MSYQIGINDEPEPIERKWWAVVCRREGGIDVSAAHEDETGHFVLLDGEEADGPFATPEEAFERAKRWKQESSESGEL